MQTNDTVLCSKRTYRTHSKTTRPDTTDSLLDTFGWFTLWWTNMASCIILPAIYIYMFVWRVSHSLGLKGVHVLNSLSGMCVPVNLFEYRKKWNNWIKYDNHKSVPLISLKPQKILRTAWNHHLLTLSPLITFNNEKQSKVSSFVVCSRGTGCKIPPVLEPVDPKRGRARLDSRVAATATVATSSTSHWPYWSGKPSKDQRWIPCRKRGDTKIPCRDTFFENGELLFYTCCGMETGESF